MSRPSNTIEPPSAKCAPAMALRSVLLPEPFGPIRPWKLPAATSTSTPSSARNVRKLLLTPRISSNAMAASPALPAATVGADALAVRHNQAEYAFGLEQHHRKQHDAEDDRPDLLDGIDVGLDVGQHFHRRRPQDRSDQGARS